MSLRSSARPCSSCSGDRYAGVPSDLARARDDVAVAGVPAPLGDAEVDEDDAPLGREEHVRRLEVAVDDPGVVRGDERLGRLRSRTAAAVSADRAPRSASTRFRSVPRT